MSLKSDGLDIYPIYADPEDFLFQLHDDKLNTSIELALLHGTGVKIYWCLALLIVAMRLRLVYWHCFCHVVEYMGVEYSHCLLDIPKGAVLHSYQQISVHWKSHGSRYHPPLRYDHHQFLLNLGTY